MLYQVFLLLKEAHCIKLILMFISREVGTSPCCKLRYVTTEENKQEEQVVLLTMQKYSQFLTWCSV